MWQAQCSALGVHMNMIQSPSPSSFRSPEGHSQDHILHAHIYSRVWILQQEGPAGGSEVAGPREEG